MPLDDLRDDRNSMFAVSDFSFGYGGAGPLALSHVDFELFDGEFVAIVGPSGCGKSTLLRIIAQLTDTPVPVRIPLKKELIDSGRVGVMFQSAVLFPWLTVWENMLFPTKLVKRPPASTGDLAVRARLLLDRVGLTDFLGHYCFQLSGGMQQRLCLARSLLLKPPILLLDEPFGALDAITREALNGELQALWLEEKPTVLLITHDISEAVYLADRVLVMSARPGRIAADIRIDLPRPRHQTVKFTPEFNRMAAAVHGELNGA